MLRIWRWLSRRAEEEETHRREQDVDYAEEVANRTLYNADPELAIELGYSPPPIISAGLVAVGVYQAALAAAQYNGQSRQYQALLGQQMMNSPNPWPGLAAQQQAQMMIPGTFNMQDLLNAHPGDIIPCRPHSTGTMLTQIGSVLGNPFGRIM